MARRFSSLFVEGVAFTTIVAAFVATSAVAAQAAPRLLAQVSNNLTVNVTNSNLRLIPVPIPPVVGPVTAICIGGNAERICPSGGSGNSSSIILLPDSEPKDSFIMEKQTLFTGGSLENSFVGRRINLFAIP